MRRSGSTGRSFMRSRAVAAITDAAYTTVRLEGVHTAKRKEITCTFYIGDKQVDKLPEDYLDKMMENLGKAMSEYYTRHPDEYAIILENDRKMEMEKSNENDIQISRSHGGYTDTYRSDGAVRAYRG